MFNDNCKISNTVIIRTINRFGKKACTFTFQQINLIKFQ